MESILDTGNNKEKCQKFTPLNIVENMLDIAEYNTNLMGKKVLENSFGSGNILKSIVRRYIKDSLNKGIPPNRISIGIENDIYGIEIDKALYTNCINDLNNMISYYELPPVKWSLYNVDALEWNNPVKFQFIIGNPPYIAYRFIDENNRKKLKEKYITCSKGKFDYCYAFIESAIQMLNEKGKLIQLVPSNIYKNVFANELRKLLLPQIVSIHEYPNKKIFGSTLTSSSIFLYDKNYSSTNIKYKNVTDRKNYKVLKNTLCDKWVFKNQLNNKKEVITFGDRFHASISIATQLNEAFLVTNDCDTLEPSILKKAVAPRALNYGKKESIIFPYYYDEKGKINNYTEEQFKKDFPLTALHLSKYKDRLLKRDADPKAKWFEYGRSQALAHLNQDKLLLSTVITNKVKIYKLDAETIPYSGIYITVKDKHYTLDDAFQILMSEQFMEYVVSLGISVSGKSKRITCKDINNYEFIEEEE